MTFPVIVSHTITGGSGATHGVTIPACAVGDLILVISSVDNQSSGGPTTLADFTRLIQQSDGGGFLYAQVFSRVITGAESWYNAGAGGSVTMTHNAAEICVYAVLRLTGGTGNVEAAGVGGTGHPNPPSLSPSWLVQDTRWLAVGANDDGDATWAADPSGYTAVDRHGAGSSFLGAALSVAYRDATTATEDPGAFSYSGAHCVGITVAIESTAVAPPVEGPPYEAPLPGGALVEIYAAEPGAYRWGLAHWGESVWSAAGWQDVTPESVDVEILWGSQRPELGILSKPEAGSWAIDFYDPDRTLDPANASGPWYGDLEPGLPVRISHNELVIKQGIAEEIGYVHSREFGAEHYASLRVTDVISVLANAMVPDDSVLADTLFARARDAVAAAGVPVTVLGTPAAGDWTLAPWVTGQERTAWEWIVDAAESVLHIPYVTNVGHLGFRRYATPLNRGRALASPNLVGLQSIIAHNGLYSVVTALQSPAEGGAVITRELTPKPRYGARQYDRDEPTPNAGDWAMAVLSDRSTAGLRWVPGEVYPLTAADVTYFAQIEGMERVGVYYPEAAPAVVQDVIIVGGRITVTAKKDSEAVWSFSFEAAQAAPTPLVDDLDATTLLARDDDPSALLYPDG